MTILGKDKTILELADLLVFTKTGTHLNEPQRALLLATWSWERQNYDQIAESCGYSANYLRKHVGPDLWKLLSNALGERVSKVNSRSAFERHLFAQQTRAPLTLAQQLVTSPEADSPPQENSRQDWGEAIDVEVFYGREAELATLNHWIGTDRCRVVGIFGGGGMGKTYLSLKLARQIRGQFESVIWRSLRNAPTLPTLLTDLIQFFSPQALSTSAKTVEQLISWLIDYFRSHRCLLILDNVETILLGGTYVGKYRAGYEPYGELLRRLGETIHQSSWVLTSREKPRDHALLEGASLPVRSLHLKGLGAAEGQKIFQSKGITLQVAAQTRQLIHTYAGNPLALKMVAATIQDLFDGNVAEFLSHDTALLGDIGELLDQHLERLSAPEKTILYWLAIAREPITIDELRQDIVPTLSPRVLLEALKSLGQRSLIEQSEALFSLQPVVMEYLIERLIEQVCDEIQSWQPGLSSAAALWLKTHALIKAQAKDYIREAQTRLILHPVAEQLQASCKTRQEIANRFEQMLAEQRSQAPREPGYLAGNLINLLRQLEWDLSGADFSQLAIWQANLEGANLHRVNLTDADLSRSVLTETFASALSVAFSPDGTRLAIATTDNDICLWQTDGHKLQVCQGHTGWVHSVAFSPDSQTLVSGSEDGTVKVWDGQTGQCLKTLTGHSNWVWAIAVSPDGCTIASGSNDHTIRLWDAVTGTCLQVLSGHSHWIWSVAFSADCQTLASGSTDATVRLWDIQTGQCRHILDGHENWVQSVAFNPTGNLLASGSNDQTIKLWDWQTGQCLKTLRGHINWVQSITFSPDGQTLASGSNDQTMKVWDVSTGDCLRTLQGYTKDIWSVAFSPDGTTLASGGSNQTVKLWDVKTGQCRKTLQGYINGIVAISISPDGTLLASGSSDHTIRLWNLRTQHCIRTLLGHTSWVRSVCFSPDGTQLASGSSDHTIRLWNVQTGQCLKVLAGHQSWVRSVCFSPDGTQLASGSTDHTIRLWNPHTGECLKSLHGHDNWVRCVTFSPDGTRLISSSDDQTICVWDGVTGECLHRLRGHTSGIWSVAVSPDGTLIASGSDDQTIRIWDLFTGACLQILTGHTNWVQAIAFSPSGHLIASGSNDQQVKLWDTATGACVKTLSGHSHRIWSVAFTPDGTQLASGSEDETIKLYEIESGVCLTTLKAIRLCEAMNITRTTGLTLSQKNTLKLLGAVEDADCV